MTSESKDLQRSCQENPAEVARCKVCGLEIGQFAGLGKGLCSLINSLDKRP